VTSQGNVEGSVTGFHFDTQFDFAALGTYIGAVLTTLGKNLPRLPAAIRSRRGSIGPFRFVC